MMRQKIPVIAAKARNFFLFFFLINSVTLFIFIHYSANPSNVTRGQQSRLSVMDTFFISHGSPTLSIDESLPARGFLQAWQAKVFSQRPNSILVISAHWDTDFPSVNVVQRNDTIHDFYGFPKQMYDVRIPSFPYLFDFLKFLTYYKFLFFNLFNIHVSIS